MSVLDRIASASSVRAELGRREEVRDGDRVGLDDRKGALQRHEILAPFVRKDARGSRAAPGDDGPIRSDESGSSEARTGRLSTAVPDHPPPRTAKSARE